MSCSSRKIKLAIIQTSQLHIFKSQRPKKKYPAPCVRCCCVCDILLVKFGVSGGVIIVVWGSCVPRGPAHTVRAQKRRRRPAPFCTAHKKGEGLNCGTSGKHCGAFNSLANGPFNNEWTQTQGHKMHNSLSIDSSIKRPSLHGTMHNSPDGRRRAQKRRRPGCKLNDVLCMFESAAKWPVQRLAERRR